MRLIRSHALSTIDLLRNIYQVAAVSPRYSIHSPTKNTHREPSLMDLHQQHTLIIEFRPGTSFYDA